MSTLTKVFIILVLCASLVSVGIVATLFGMVADFKHKWVTEVNAHYNTLQIKNAEIAAGEIEMENQKLRMDVLNKTIDILNTENASKGSRIADLQKNLDTMTSNYAKLSAAQEALTDQLNAQMAQLTEMTTKVEEFRSKLAKSIADRSTAVQELQYARQEAERLQKDLADLEEKHVTLAREKKKYEEIIAHLNERDIRTDIGSPRKPLDGKVTAVSDEIGLVIISIGKDDGVLEGDEFTLYRGSLFVAKIVVDRVDRKWAAGRTVLKKDRPQVSDDVSNHIMGSQRAEGQ